MIELTANPRIVILAGPNGAGKSTAAPLLLQRALRVDEFVNADTIARGLSAFAPERVAFRAGRIMLRRLDELAAQRVSFAFETTLASRTYAPWFKRLLNGGHDITLLFLWLSAPDIAVARVAGRVRAGGHDVPIETIRRRYDRGLRNFFGIYRKIVSAWRVCDNNTRHGPRLIAGGGTGQPDIIRDQDCWQRVQESADA